jgi:hypothetical protein
MRQGCRARKVLAAVGLAALAAFAPPAFADAEVHGESDVFATDGVAIAWGVLRAANPDDATVVTRVVRDAVRFPALGVVAVDPFGGASQTVRPASPAPAALDVSTPRKRFADFPRTELKLYAVPHPGASQQPVLTIFYVGVPDTAPEFDSEAKLRAWLDDRIARLRASPGGRKP